MAGGPTPPPEEDLAHSCLTVNWEVSVERQKLRVPEDEEICYCHFEYLRFFGNEYIFQ